MSLPPDAPDWAPVPAGVSHIAGLLAEVHSPGANQGQVRCLCVCEGFVPAR